METTIEVLEVIVFITGVSRPINLKVGGPFGREIDYVGIVPLYDSTISRIQVDFDRRIIKYSALGHDDVIIFNAHLFIKQWVK